MTTMKRNPMKYTILLFTLLPFLLQAQIPMGLSFQSVVRDENNNLLASRDLEARIDIVHKAAETTLVFSEGHDCSTNINGLAYLTIGQGENEFGNLSEVDWKSGGLSVRFFVEISGTFVLIEELPLGSFPYAFHTALTDSIFGYSFALPAGEARGDLIYWDGEAWAGLSAGAPGDYLNASAAGMPYWESPADNALRQELLGILNEEIDMLTISGGVFSRGCATGELPEEICALDEFPLQEITIADFNLGKTEVTQRLWTSIMGFNPSVYVCTSCPVTNISWYDVQVFINRLNRITGKSYRLPSESEWEYAAKEGLTADLNSTAVYAANSGKIQQVASKAADGLGLYDMRGNVWEWVSDWYHAAYYGREDLDNPVGPFTGIRKSIRGCAYDSTVSNCLISNREALNPDSRRKNIGFRLAASAE